MLAAIPPIDVIGYIKDTSTSGWYKRVRGDQLSNLVPVANIYHGLDTIQTQLVLGADQGKVLNDKFTNYFGKGDKGNPTELNNLNLIGCYFAQDTACSHLPTSSLGYYYWIACLGQVQFACRYNSNGTHVVYWRGNVNNDTWYPWKQINGTNNVESLSGNSTKDITLPNSSGGIRITCVGVSDAMGEAICRTQSSGSMDLMVIKTGSQLTITTPSKNVIRITNNSAYGVIIYIEYLNA